MTRENSCLKIKGKCHIQCFKECRKNPRIELTNKNTLISNLELLQSQTGKKRSCRPISREKNTLRRKTKDYASTPIEVWTCTGLQISNTKMVLWPSQKTNFKSTRETTTACLLKKIQRTLKSAATRISWNKGPKTQNTPQARSIRGARAARKNSSKGREAADI